MGGLSANSLLTIGWQSVRGALHQTYPTLTYISNYTEKKKKQDLSSLVQFIMASKIHEIHAVISSCMPSCFKSTIPHLDKILQC